MHYFAGPVCDGWSCAPLLPVINWYLVLGLAIAVISFVKMKSNKDRAALGKRKKWYIVAGLFGLSSLFWLDLSRLAMTSRDQIKARSLNFDLYHSQNIPNWAINTSTQIVSSAVGPVYQQKYFTKNSDGQFMVSQYNNANFVGSESKCRASNPQWDVYPEDFLGSWFCEPFAKVGNSQAYVLYEGIYDGSKRPLHYFLVLGSTRISIKQTQQQSKWLSETEARSLLLGLEKTKNGNFMRYSCGNYSWIPFVEEINSAIYDEKCWNGLVSI